MCFLGQRQKSSLCLIWHVQKVTSPEKQRHVFMSMKGTHLLQLQNDTPIQKQNTKANSKPASFLQWPLDWHAMPLPEVWQAGCSAPVEEGNSITGTVQLQNSSNPLPEAQEPSEKLFKIISGMGKVRLAPLYCRWNIYFDEVVSVYSNGGYGSWRERLKEKAQIHFRHLWGRWKANCLISEILQT